MEIGTAPAQLKTYVYGCGTESLFVLNRGIYTATGPQKVNKLTLLLRFRKVTDFQFAAALFVSRALELCSNLGHTCHEICLIIFFGNDISCHGNNVH